MTSRSERFPFEGLLSFRPIGQLEWNQGMTINVSPSGLLFRAGSPEDVGKIVQLVYALPAQLPGKGGDVIFCQGQIVRTESPDHIDCQAHMGAKILDFSPSKP